MSTKYKVTSTEDAQKRSSLYPKIISLVLLETMLVYLVKMMQFYQNCFESYCRHGLQIRAIVTNKESYCKIHCRHSLQIRAIVTNKDSYCKILFRHELQNHAIVKVLCRQEVSFHNPTPIARICNPCPLPQTTSVNGKQFLCL